MITCACMGCAAYIQGNFPPKIQVKVSTAVCRTVVMSVV